MQNAQCDIPIFNLRQSPFSLPWGSSVIARVTALNAYGSSLESLDGNGAIILTSPDAPQSLVEVANQRAATSLGLSWSAGLADGGAAV